MTWLTTRTAMSRVVVTMWKLPTWITKETQTQSSTLTAAESMAITAMQSLTPKATPFTFGVRASGRASWLTPETWSSPKTDHIVK